MSTDWNNGLLRTKGEVICLFSSDGKYIQGLYNYKTNKKHPDFKLYMPDEFYIPALIDIPTRYLIHNDQIILTRI